MFPKMKLKNLQNYEAFFALTDVILVLWDEGII